ncbi:hypothetical protein D3A96_01315 [Robertkochia marina]|nr:hypothetical protein D3A96_01315 [Robertkochia marina]
MYFSAFCQSYQFKEGDKYIVKVDALDYAFAMPDTIPSGWITFRMMNKGMDTHMAYIGRKPDSLATQEFIAMVYNPKKHYEGIGYGGPGLHSSGVASETTLYLESGEYFMGCGAITEKGIKHSKLGMVRYFHVSAEKVKSREPKADGNINITKFTLSHDLPLKGGKNTFKIIHDGPDANIHLIKFDEVSYRNAAESYLTNLTDPTPTKMLGGSEQAEKGKVVYVTLNLDPGDYSWMAYFGFPWGKDVPFTIENSGKLEANNETYTVQTAIDLTMTANGFSISEELKPGVHLIKIRPSDLKSHSPVLFRFKEGVTSDVFKDYISNFHSALVNKNKVKIEEIRQSNPWLGKEIRMNNHYSSNLKITFPPGKYALYCMHAFTTHEAHFHKEEPVFFEVK